VKVRLEVKALDKNGAVLAVDRQTDVQVGLAERVAGKQALQNAAAKIAERLLPKICK
jgi:carbon monoxide dehydrogenase subunit G